MPRRLANAMKIFLPIFAIWLLFSWPLPRYVASGIPSSSRNLETNHVRRMIPGDHLQLLYNFWLGADMMKGQTEPFHNIYEFYTGNDEARKDVHSYYLPFSFVYLLGDLVGGQAFGWNLTGFIALLVTYLLTRRLLLRYVKDELTACIFSAISILLPYRWIALLGGSPTGFAMMCVPMIVLGIDIAIRDDRWQGGLFAGLGILFACWSDRHVFFFAAMATPFCCFFSFAMREKFEWKNRRAYLKLLLAMLPMLILSALVLIYTKYIGDKLDQTTLVGGCSLPEVADYSPRAEGLWEWGHNGLSSQIYFGFVIALVIIAAWIKLGIRNRKAGLKSWILLSTLCLGIAVTVILSLGPHGPGEGMVFVWLREFIPHYSKVRQAGKIYCLMPTLLSLTGALAFVALARTGTKKYPVLLAIVVLLVLTEYRCQLRPTICLIDKEQGAYRAVAEDARAEGREPGALAVTFWPGNSHWSSLYEHYASLYRIRMINGYRPTVDKAYVDDIWQQFDSVNMGELSDTQLNDLLKMNIGHILLHEDAFPEKVSPFPVIFTLNRLLDNPRLVHVKQDTRVHAFKILAEPGAGGSVPDWGLYPPSRLWEVERQQSEKVATTRDLTVSGEHYVTLADEGAWFETHPVNTVQVDGQKWMIRARGKGKLKLTTLVAGNPSGEAEADIESDDWAWYSSMLSSVNEYLPVTLLAEHDGGQVDCDIALLYAGEWEPLQVGQTREIPAACFFRAGYSDLTTGSVTLEKAVDPTGVAFFGPNMPLEPGFYELLVVFLSDAELGTVLGTARVNSGNSTVGKFSVVAGSPAAVSLNIAENLPFRVDLKFDNSGNLRIDKLVIKRVK